MITEEHETGVVTLWGVRQQIEDSVVIWKKVPWVTGLRSDYVWALDGIAAEKDREVKTDDVIVALHGIELDGEATGVASFIRVFTANRNRRETDEDGSLFAYAGEEVGFLKEGSVSTNLGAFRQAYREGINLLSALEVSKRAGTTRVYHTLEVLGTVESLLLLE
jgi:hypothetical protein